MPDIPTSTPAPGARVPDFDAALADVLAHSNAIGWGLYALELCSNRKELRHHETMVEALHSLAAMRDRSFPVLAALRDALRRTTEGDIHALLREYVNAGYAAGLAEANAGPEHADSDPDVDRAWETCAKLRTALGLRYVGLEDEATRLRADLARVTQERDEALEDGAQWAAACGTAERERDASRAEGAALRDDKARLDWLDEHSAEVQVADDECGSVTVQSNEDYRVTGYHLGYNIRAAIDAARASRAPDAHAPPDDGDDAMSRRRETLSGFRCADAARSAIIGAASLACEYNPTTVPDREWLDDAVMWLFEYLADGWKLPASWLRASR